MLNSKQFKDYFHVQVLTYTGCRKKIGKYNLIFNYNRTKAIATKCQK